ncbi:MAG: SGNH/GDSL hydrolase family protein [Ruminococcaceae bacterium]|nr:SGNH/GDSL hydrolase family protein [Oscillospiraceae bacterium]
MIDKNKKLFHACVDVEVDEHGYRAKRFTKRQYEVYATKPWCCYPRCTAGVYMEFITDAEEISFDYYFSYLFFPQVIFDIFEDGVYMDFIREQDGSNSGHIVYRKKNPGKVCLKIYLPYNGETYISNINFGDFKTTKDRRERKLLVYGDSISQGLMGTHPCMSYVPLVADAIKADYLNLSVGGDLYDPEMLDPKVPFKPTVIIVALGANDLIFNGKYNSIKKNIENFFAKLRSIYPDAVINVITTIWQTDIENDDTEKARKKYELFKKMRAKIKKEAEKANCNVINGLEIMPHIPAYFTDHAHPNDLGFLQYALNVLRDLKY